MLVFIKGNVYWIAFNSNGRIKCTYLNNGLCQARLVNIKSYELLYFPFTVSVSECDEVCNIVDNPYACVYVPDTKCECKVFKFISRVNKHDLEFSMNHVNVNVD